LFDPFIQTECVLIADYVQNCCAQGLDIIVASSGNLSNAKIENNPSGMHVMGKKTD
jgi:hypothetical protein